MKQTFENAMARLEEISDILAENNVTLDESLKLYAEGVKLLKFCNAKLEQAQIKINDIDGNKLEVE
ncbi:MAG: exodeoxyribonuclease VII small subunit [Oscillospiraceae bacterium]|nr:exodeoxyribonuclease VII small subunit [Oscillospiraceae bacterium]